MKVTSVKMGESKATLGDAILRWKMKGVKKEDALLKAKKAVKAVNKRWTKGMQELFNTQWKKRKLTTTEKKVVKKLDKKVEKVVKKATKKTAKKVDSNRQKLIDLANEILETYIAFHEADDDVSEFEYEELEYQYEDLVKDFTPMLHKYAKTNPKLSKYASVKQDRLERFKEYQWENLISQL